MPYSMTGFARKTHQAEWGEISCEIRSVNHRYLEPSFRLPELIRSAEPELRDLLRKQLQRGKVEINIQLNLNKQSESNLAINEGNLKELSDAIAKVTKIYPKTADIDALQLLQWPGVLEQSQLDVAAIETSAINLTKQTLSNLLEHRQREGAELQQLIDDRLTEIDTLVEKVRSEMPLILEAQKNRIREKLLEFKTELDETRLEQEMVLLANKADVAEELDRLQTHLVEVQHILKQKGAIGRRLDFMMQELNREANTLSSKSLTSETTQAAVSIKVLIEQMREQIQNIE